MKYAGDSQVWKPEQVINQDPEIHGGTPVFTGTRVPVKALIDHLKAGESLDYFLEGFPSVSREQAIAFLEFRLTPKQSNHTCDRKESSRGTGYPPQGR